MKKIREYIERKIRVFVLPKTIMSGKEKRRERRAKR